MTGRVHREGRTYSVVNDIEPPLVYRVTDLDGHDVWDFVFRCDDPDLFDSVVDLAEADKSV